MKYKLRLFLSFSFAAFLLSCSPSDSNDFNAFYEIYVPYEYNPSILYEAKRGAHSIENIDMSVRYSFDLDEGDHFFGHYKGETNGFYLPMSSLFSTRSRDSYFNQEFEEGEEIEIELAYQGASYISTVSLNTFPKMVNAIETEEGMLELKWENSGANAHELFLLGDCFLSVDKKLDVNQTSLLVDTSQLEYNQSSKDCSVLVVMEWLTYGSLSEVFDKGELALYYKDWLWY